MGRGWVGRLSWTGILPVLGVVTLALTWGRSLPLVVAMIVAFVLGGVVLAAVHHAEVVAHRVGEPFGSLILAFAVTVIEVALIITMMISGGEGAASLARDTVFAAAMITMNGIVGLSLLLAAVRHRFARFNPEGSGQALATVTALATLSLVLPTFTTSTPGPQFNATQLIFAAVSSLILYGGFVATQTVRHRDFFLPVESAGPVGSPGADGEEAAEDDDDAHAPRPSRPAALTSLGLLLVSLVAVVGLAKVESPLIETVVLGAGLPPSVVGVVIALLVLLPESLAASRAAWRHRTQISLNLAYGSAMASIGLTVPAIAAASIFLDGPLLLGLDPTQMVLLALTVVVSVLTVVPGRATRLHGLVHVVLFAAFLLLAVSP